MIICLGNGEKYKFVPDSSLQKYLMNRQQVPNVFTLQRILDIVKGYMRREKMFDEKNSVMVLCSESLEAAIHVTAMHISQLSVYVKKQLFAIRSLRYSNTSFEPKHFALKTLVDNRKCTISLSLSLLLSKYVSSYPTNRYIFEFGEVCDFVNTYILLNSTKLLDKRNIVVCICKGDPLQYIFNVNAFHRSQLLPLIRAQVSFI